MLLVVCCTTAPLPTASSAPTPSPVPTLSPTPSTTPVTSHTATQQPALWCSDAVGIVDHTARMQGCEDLGTVEATSFDPHVANHAADLSGLRVWWSSPHCVSVWHLDVHETPYGVTIEILDEGQECSGDPVGHAIDLQLHPILLAADVALLHNGNLIVNLPPVPTPHPGTFPGTPSSIQFGRWELAHGEHPTRDATTIHVVVYEKACASGQSPEGRILEPFLAYDDRNVSIAFAIWSLAGAQTCVDGPGVPYTVELSQPLGRRHLEDGARILDYFFVAESFDPFRPH
jgi:hypothetical protein